MKQKIQQVVVKYGIHHLNICEIVRKILDPNGNVTFNIRNTDLNALIEPSPDIDMEETLQPAVAEVPPNNITTNNYQMNLSDFDFGGEFNFGGGEFNFGNTQFHQTQHQPLNTMNDMLAFDFTTPYLNQSMFSTPITRPIVATSNENPILLHGLYYPSMSSSFSSPVVSTAPPTPVSTNKLSKVHYETWPYSTGKVFDIVDIKRIYNNGESTLQPARQWLSVHGVKYLSQNDRKKVERFMSLVDAYRFQCRRDDDEWERVFENCESTSALLKRIKNLGLVTGRKWCDEKGMQYAYDLGEL